MTPTAQERIIRCALPAILKGDGTIESRLDRVIELLSTLPPTDKRRIGSKLKIRLARALREKQAVVTTALPLDNATRSQLASLAQSRGLLPLDEQVKKGLLAGFELQMGDDRFHYDLLSRVLNFSQS